MHEPLSTAAGRPEALRGSERGTRAIAVEAFQPSKQSSTHADHDGHASSHLLPQGAFGRIDRPFNIDEEPQ